MSKSEYTKGYEAGYEQGRAESYGDGYDAGYKSGNERIMPLIMAIDIANRNMVMIGLAFCWDRNDFVPGIMVPNDKIIGMDTSRGQANE